MTFAGLQPPLRPQRLSMGAAPVAARQLKPLAAKGLAANPANPADALNLRFGDSQPASPTPPAVSAPPPLDVNARSRVFTIARPEGLPPIRMREWSPSLAVSPRRPTNGPPILLVHGGASRSAWLSPLAWRLVDKHPNVYGIDLNQIAYAPENVSALKDYRTLTQELRDAAQWLQQQHGQPVVLVAHSIGALVATGLATQLATENDLDRAAGKKPSQPLLKGLVLLAPTYEGAATSLDLLRGAAYYKRLTMEKLGYAQPPLSLPPSHRMENLTDNPEKHRLLKEATDKVTRFTATAWEQIHQLSQWVEANKAEVTQSVLMFTPGDDRVASLPAMIDRFNHFKSWDKQLITFTNAKHDLVWEPVMPQMADVINRWIAARSVKVL